MSTVLELEKMSVIFVKRIMNFSLPHLEPVIGAPRTNAMKTECQAVEHVALSPPSVTALLDSGMTASSVVTVQMAALAATQLAYAKHARKVFSDSVPLMDALITAHSALLRAVTSVSLKNHTMKYSASTSLLQKTVYRYGTSPALTTPGTSESSEDSNKKRKT